MASEICRLPLSASDRALCLGRKGPIGAHAQSLLADGQTRRFVSPIGPCTGMGAADEPRPVTPRTLHIFPSEHHNFFNAFRRTFAIVHYGGGPKSNAKNLGSGRHPIPDTTVHKKKTSCKAPLLISRAILGFICNAVIMLGLEKIHLQRRATVESVRLLGPRH